MTGIAPEYGAYISPSNRVYIDKADLIDDLRALAHALGPRGQDAVEALLVVADGIEEAEDRVVWGPEDNR